MTLTPSRPVPAAATAAQQRLEVELLLGEAVLSTQELQAAGPQRWSWCDALPADQCRQLGCLPVQRQGDSLLMAVPSHWGEEQRAQLLQMGAAAGLSLSLRLALPAEIADVLESEKLRSEELRSEENQNAERQHENENEPTAGAAQDNATNASDAIRAGSTTSEPDHTAAPPAAPQQPMSSLVEDLQLAGPLEAVADEDFSDIDVEKSLSGSNASPVITLVDKVLVRALGQGASDIHLEPQEDGLLIRFRQDGVLEPLEKLPKNLIPAVTSRVKIIADLDIAERRLPQDGRIRRRYQGKVFDLRVSTLPTRYGEKVCMRLLDSGATHLGLDKLISDPPALASVRDMGSKPFGMILVTGPTGSGKSTTLYSLLAERNSPGVNISTVEDPIEYSLKGITQTQVNRDKGYDFAMALRAFMRQDPDVLLVGETRDLETAKTAIEAALTGHLVLTTLHCNDAPSAVARLSEMGVEPFMVSASLVGIVSQRLVRRVCPQCRVAYRPDPSELSRFGLLASREQSVTFYKARRGGGTPCATCQGIGYRGRVGVYEVLRINEEMAGAIAQQATTEQIRKLALEGGMKTLLGYSLELVRQGQTTLDEVERMILTDSGLESERRAKALHAISCQGCGAGLQDSWLECPYCLTPRQLF